MSPLTPPTGGAPLRVHVPAADDASGLHPNTSPTGDPGSVNPPTYLKAECGVRYWEDATVNGVVDDEGTLIPLRSGDDWRPTINLTTGIIEDWPAGVEADIHYKVCDDGNYILLDADRNEIARRGGYVPAIMGPGGYGDYVILKIDGSGQIQGYKYERELPKWFEGS